MARNKRERVEQALKREKAKRNKRIIIIAATAVVLAAVVIVSAIYAAGTERYAYDTASIELRPGGRFRATLYHSGISGTYAKTEDSVTFTYDGISVTAVLDGDFLHLPEEWDDGHGHGAVLAKQ